MTIIMKYLKYLLLGTVVGLSTYYIKGDRQDSLIMGAVAAAVFLALDLLLPSIMEMKLNLKRFELFNGAVDGADGIDIEGLDSEEDGLASTDVNRPYKLVDGRYSAKVLLPGYNELVQPYNTIYKYTSEPGTLESIALLQQGGDGTPQIPTAAVAAPDQKKTSSMTLPPNVDSPVTYRHDNTLYSGDIINIMSEGHGVMQRKLTDSQVIFDAPLANVGTNFSKLRFVLDEHKSHEQRPIRYGDVVFLMHNVYFGGKNVSKYIKYGDKLQSHQDGSHYRTYKLIDPTNPSSTDPVMLNRDILISGEEQDDNKFLRVEADKTITSKTGQAGASKFRVLLNRAYELHNRNLCICPDEMLNL